MDEFMESVLSQWDLHSKRKSCNDDKRKSENKMRKEDNEDVKEEEWEQANDLDDIREENRMLRSHMEELNKHVLSLSTSKKVEHIQKELEHANELRRSGT